MTARVMLNLDEGEAPTGEWLAELIAWDLSPIAGRVAHRRCQALILIVAAHHATAVADGPTAWPTLAEVADYLRVREHAYGQTGIGSELAQMLTVAIAGGWLVYADDGIPQ
jgi:hypothetical protein